MYGYKPRFICRRLSRNTSRHADVITRSYRGATGDTVRWKNPPPLFFVTLTNQANAARTKCLSGNLTVDIGYRGYWYLSQPTQKYTYKPPKYELELLAMPHSNLVKNQPISITFVFSTFWENFTPENNNNAHLPCVLLPTCHDTLGDSNLIFRQ